MIRQHFRAGFNTSKQLLNRVTLARNTDTWYCYSVKPEYTLKFEIGFIGQGSFFVLFNFDGSKK